MSLLAVKDLRVTFATDDGIVRAVNGLSFNLAPGETLGIVGESGSGKSVTALSIMRLIASPPGRIENGKIVFKDTDLLTIDEQQMRRIRGNKISMIFQDPMTSLNPVLTIGDQITETIVLHQHKTKAEARKRAIEMLDLVRIPDAEKTYNSPAISSSSSSRGCLPNSHLSKPSMPFLTTSPSSPRHSSDGRRK